MFNDPQCKICEQIKRQVLTLNNCLDCFLIQTSTITLYLKTGAIWRYVRASMSYAWLLPPICDPLDGHLLMDGCYVNNVPGDVMLRSSCSHIIVVDVTAPDDTDLFNYGDTLRSAHLQLSWNVSQFLKLLILLIF